jgi:hypothetical protein
MSYATLKAEISKGSYAGKTYPEILAAVRAVTATRTVPTLVTTKSLYESLGALAAETLLQKLVTVAEGTDSTHKEPLTRILAWLAADGFDVGSTVNRTYIDALATASVIAAGDATTLKGLATQTYYPFADVMECDVVAASLYG